MLDQFAATAKNASPGLVVAAVSAPAESWWATILAAVLASVVGGIMTIVRDEIRKDQAARIKLLEQAVTVAQVNANHARADLERLTRKAGVSSDPGAK